jgi:hypothetical protein
MQAAVLGENVEYGYDVTVYDKTMGVKTPISHKSPYIASTLAISTFISEDKDNKIMTNHYFDR